MYAHFVLEAVPAFGTAPPDKRASHKIHNRVPFPTPAFFQ